MLLALLGPGLGDSLQQHPLAALAALFGAGLLTSLSPCIFPMIPITVGIITGSDGAGAAPRPKGRVVGRTLTYVLGLALFYAIMGLVAGLTGSLFGTVASNPWVRFAVANLLVLFALALLDVFPSTPRGGSPPGPRASREARIPRCFSSERRRGSWQRLVARRRLRRSSPGWRRPGAGCWASCISLFSHWG